MKTLHDIFSDGPTKTVEKLDNGKNIIFYAFNGYMPIIKNLIEQKVHLPGTQGCFSQMFIEKDKAKALSVIKNKNGIIESVCFVIQDSWIIGNSIPSGPKYIGNIGYFTHEEFRGQGHAHILSKNLEKNLSLLVPDLTERVGHIQYHVCDKFRKNFNQLQIAKMRYCENFLDFFDPSSLKNPYSVDLSKENKKQQKEFFDW